MENVFLILFLIAFTISIFVLVSTLFDIHNKVCELYEEMKGGKR